MNGNSETFRGRGSYRGHKRFRGNGGGAHGKYHPGSYGGNNSHKNVQRSDGGSEEFTKFRDKQQQVKNQRQNQRGHRHSTYSATWTRCNSDGVGDGDGRGQNWNHNQDIKMEETIPSTMTGESNSRRGGGAVKPCNRTKFKYDGTAVNSTSTATISRENKNRRRNEAGGAANDGNHSINESGITNSTMLAGDVGRAGNISATTSIIPQEPTPIAAPKQSSAIEDKKEVLRKIKIEKSQIKLKPTPPQPSQTKSSPSSSASSSSDDDYDEKDDTVAGETTKSKQTPPPSIDNKQKPEAMKSIKDNYKKVVIEPTPSSSSSSEDSSSASNEEQPSSSSKNTMREPIKQPTITTEKKSKKSKVKPPVDEDLICLGNLSNKYVIDDDDAKVMDKEQQGPASLKSEQCLLCDKKDHTAFQCQMICKNCSAPYHNHKSCPKPANLTIMLQYFMEFCMQQIQHFNPEQKFVFPLNFNSQGGVAPMANKASTSAKRKRGQVRDSEDDNDDFEEETANSTANTADDFSDAQSSESEYSVATSSSAKIKRPNLSSHINDAVAFNSLYGSAAAGITPFSALPAAALPAAALAAYNPMIFNQMLLSGFVGALNFKK